MTITAAKLLDDAWELYYKIATQPDDTSISWQTTNISEPLATPYDNAARLCRSLLPYVYGYSSTNMEATDAIWTNMVDQLQVLTMEQAQKFTKMCNTCGHTTNSYAHYCECEKPRIEAEAIAKYCPPAEPKPQHGGDGPW